eukprot:CAMPEP_0119338140 /NCGR_PEP_ID=MMETSP1333-20130426/95430_1 /TAXON_ID=418940 /ORGANISM="Scyphosphaera apsteinii, Strain RCC1455" /LENGTH=288 /DNA_ID=CAMNT_0007349349 /DNA_START=245 /DNA_END=1111 /DNA_ORIENTATION=+
MNMLGELSRRQMLNHALQTFISGAGVGIAGLVHLQTQQLRLAPGADSLSEDDELFALHSLSGPAAILERKVLEAEWRALRQQGPTVEETRRAFRDVVSVRDAIDSARQLASARRWDELNELLPASTVPQLEHAATVLASSHYLQADERTAIGWQWGACGNKQCGAQADAGQALCKLRASLGMVVPLEALFYLDIALRATDEIVAVGVCAGMLPRSTLGARDYLPTETLELILPPEDLASGDANLPITKAGATEAEESLKQYEATMLGEFEALTTRVDASSFYDSSQAG